MYRTPTRRLTSPARTAAVIDETLCDGVGVGVGGLLARVFTKSKRLRRNDFTIVRKRLRNVIMNIFSQQKNKKIGHEFLENAFYFTTCCANTWFSYYGFRLLKCFNVYFCDL